MVRRKVRAAVARLVVVAGLAVAVTAGSVAVGHPSQASAMPSLADCYTSYRLGQSWQVYGDLMWGYGYYSQARVAYSVANSYFSVCGGGEEI
jgi:hypothetical protein